MERQSVPCDAVPLTRRLPLPDHDENINRESRWRASLPAATARVT